MLETGILIFRVERGTVQDLWAQMSDLHSAYQLGALRAPDLP